MKKNIFIYITLISFLLMSCISTKDVRYLQPNENLNINDEGLIPYNIPTYRITKNDMLSLNVITTPKGDAAQFYSTYNASNTTGSNAATMTGSSGNFYFTGLKVDSKGDVNVFGIGYIKAEGRTLEEVSKELQMRVNENFLPDKSEVRLNIDGIRYFVLGDVESTGMTGEKVSRSQTLTITEALAANGGLNRTVDRKNIVIHRKLPEGIKIAKIDLTREDVMNSPYYWVQNGDEIYLNTRARNLHGFGKDPIQSLVATVSIFTTALSVYLLITKL